jgi:preprotein translocase subunit SecD
MLSQYLCLESSKKQHLREIVFLILTNTISISINLLVQEIRVIINYQNTNEGLDASGGVAVDAGVHGPPAVVVVAKTLLQLRSWLESVALRTVEARELR